MIYSRYGSTFVDRALYLGESTSSTGPCQYLLTVCRCIFNRFETAVLFKPASRNLRISTIVPTFVRCAHSLYCGRIGLPPFQLQGVGPFSFPLLAKSDGFSWPFVSIIKWPPTVQRFPSFATCPSPRK